MTHKTAIYTLTSELHDAEAVTAASREFLEELCIDYELKGNDYSDYGDSLLNIIYVRTGGTEGIFLRLLPQLLERSRQPFYLLTSGKSNSLAASMEILSYLNQHNLKGEIIHGSSSYISKRIGLLAGTEDACRKLCGMRLGIIGQPSDWLIASHADRERVKERTGIELVEIEMQTLLASIKARGGIYEALKDIIGIYGLQGFTLRCFDLLTTVRDTGCMALARLNSEGYVAGCEGDVPAMLTMVITRALTGVSGFQANPANINPETGELLMAHCTIPLDMVERYETDTHYESGIGTAVRGYMKPGAVTIFKMAGDLSRCFIAEGELVDNQSKPGLCRTQQLIRLSDIKQASYFLTNPIGNHHIVMPGHQRELLETVFAR